MNAVVYASRAALAQAQQLRPGLVLENMVERSICQGKKRPYPPDGVQLRPLSREERFVMLDARLGCVVTRVPSRLNGGKAWKVTRLVEMKPPREQAA